MHKCRSGTKVLTFFFFSKYSLFPLGMFSLQGLLDDSGAQPHGREWLQISHRFNVLQLSLEHLEGQDTELKSALAFQLLSCNSACAVPSVLCSEAAPARLPAIVRLPTTGV